MPEQTPVAEPRTGRAGRGRRLRRKLKSLENAYHDLLRQMELAERVQRSMLPRRLPHPPGVELGAGLRPAQHVAGDFYNAFRLDHDRTGFYLGDVMGHGPAAALLSVYVMQAFFPKRVEGTEYEIIPPAQVLERLNRKVLAAEFPDQPFLTMVYGIFDAADRTWTYCCAGHPPPLVLRPEGPPATLETTAPLLGVMEAPFSQATVALRPGESLVLFSDGALTARWGSSGPGLDGLATFIGTREGRASQALVDGALAAADFGTEQNDDIALLVARAHE
jgi:phosphoserine phosphatase RsbU/P